MTFEPLRNHAEAISSNFNGLLEHRPDLAAAAELVHQTLSSLLFQDVSIRDDDAAADAARTMGFGAHSSWVMAFVLTASGHYSGGLALIRRAIEFACYAAKVHDRRPLAEAWMCHREDEKARRLFVRSCKIPDAYGGEQYRLLRPAIVYYDFASDYGTHGNMETLVANLGPDEAGRPRFAFQANQADVPLSTGVCLLLGYRILQSLRSSLDSMVADQDLVDLQVQAVADAVRTARERGAKLRYAEGVPRHVSVAIATDDSSRMDELFAELMAKARARPSS